MRLSLKMKLLAAFAFVGLSVLLVSALVYYTSFRNAAFGRLEAELMEEARGFAGTITFQDGTALVLDREEWREADKEEGVEDFEFVVATDSQFKTLRQTANLGALEVQRFYAFQPASTPRTVYFNIDAMRLMCVVFPVQRDGKGVAYILAGASVQQVTDYVDILNDTIALTLIVVMLLGTGLAYVMANRMVQPVLSIRRAVGEMDLGNLDRRIELVQADSEIQSLVETLNSLFERLERSYNEINNFSSNVAHELHTPLTILRGNIEVALTREREKEEYIEILSDLLEETMHIIHIVDSLLLLARGDTSSLSITRTPIDLTQFCEEQSRDWETVCSLKNQSLALKVQEPCTVEGDRNLLSQLFLNLVSNASKYSDDGRPVEIDIQRQDGAFNGSGGVQVTVRDQGIGIPEADQKKVFERFYRVRKDRSRETGGVGLGLSICKMIAELHGGSITLTSAMGSGTTVSLMLPSANEPSDGVKMRKA
jgi:heavy metal sensor kinase